MGQYERRVEFRLPQTVYYQLCQHAKAEGKTVSEILRRQVQRRPVDDPELKNELQDLIYEINRIGNNINQIVKRANSGIYTQPDKENLAAGLARVEDLMEDVRERCYRAEYDKAG